jgi:hypothetical protein
MYEFCSSPPDSGVLARQAARQARHPLRALRDFVVQSFSARFGSMAGGKSARLRRLYPDTPLVIGAKW